MCRFFIDTRPEPGMSVAVTQQDKAKISQRINRFGKQGASEGNMNYRKKLSVDELVKSVVSLDSSP